MGNWGLFDQRKSRRWDVLLSYVMCGAVRRGAVDFMTPKGRTKTDVWRSWEDELDLRKSKELVVTSGERVWGRGILGVGGEKVQTMMQKTSYKALCVNTGQGG